MIDCPVCHSAIRLGEVHLTQNGVPVHTECYEGYRCPFCNEPAIGGEPHEVCVDEYEWSQAQAHVRKLADDAGYPSVGDLLLTLMDREPDIEPKHLMALEWADMDRLWSDVHRLLVDWKQLVDHD